MGRLKDSDVLEINSYCFSKNGYPVYDLMVKGDARDPSGARLDGYISASGTIFYTENDFILENFKKVHDGGDIKKTLEFIKNSIGCVMMSSDVPVMDGNEQLAYSHLSSPATVKDTLKKSYYGAAHLVLEDKVLVFHQNKKGLSDFFSPPVDLNDPVKYRKLQKTIAQKYEAGELLPEATLTGKAFERVKNSLSPEINHVLGGLLEKIENMKEEFNLDFKMITPDNMIIIKTKDGGKLLAIGRNEKEEIEIADFFGNTVMKDETDALVKVYNDVMAQKELDFFKRVRSTNKM